MEWTAPSIDVPNSVVTSNYTRISITLTDATERQLPDYDGGAIAEGLITSGIRPARGGERPGCWGFTSI